jgi:hypothetical protein
MANENSVTTISQASTYEEIAEFWDTHSGADYADRLVEVDMTIDPMARHSYVSIETDLMQALRRIAQQRRVSPETLINVWLQRQVDGLRQEDALPVLRESGPE